MSNQLLTVFYSCCWSLWRKTITMTSDVTHVTVTCCYWLQRIILWCFKNVLDWIWGLLNLLLWPELSIIGFKRELCSLHPVLDLHLSLQFAGLYFKLDLRIDSQDFSQLIKVLGCWLNGIRDKEFSKTHALNIIHLQLQG